MAPVKSASDTKKRKTSTPQKQTPATPAAASSSGKKSKVEQRAPAEVQVVDQKPPKDRNGEIVATEEYFPRGGASALTPLEYRDVTDQARKDILFEQTETQEKPKQKKKRRRGEDESHNGELESKKSRMDDTSFAETLSFKRLDVGMSLLGSVKEINELDLAVSLPGQLTGYVSITEISDAITAQLQKAVGDDEESGDDESPLPELKDLFSIGQVVSCVVTDLEHDTGTGEEGTDKASGRRRVALSLKPEAVNANLSTGDLVEGFMLPATIMSEEDHGYILSFGIEGISGFLLRKNANTYISERNGGRPLKVGQLVYGGVLKIDDTRRVVSVTLDSAGLTKSVIPASHAAGFDTLKAGALVNAKIKAVLDNGLLLTFLGVLEGTINLAHAGLVVRNPEEDLDAHYKAGQKVRARILYISASRKKIALTLAPHLLNSVPYQFPPQSVVDVGSIVEGLAITRIDGKVGVLVEHPTYGLGYTHISRLSDSPIDKIEKKFKIGSQHRGRVLGFDYCDGLLQLTFQKSILEQRFMRHSDIKPGMTVKGQVVKLTPAGMIVALSSTINGLCPKNHLSDINLSNPEKMFKIGASIKCQVLSVDVKEKRVILTHKKTLMSSNLPRILSYADAKVGDLVHGVISSVKDFGCIVSFYNGVRALAPLSELSEKFVEDPSKLFTVGQVVKCRVISVDVADEKMRVSFKLLGKGPQGSLSLDAVNIGDTLGGKIISVLLHGVLIELKPSLVRGYLTKAHLTDHPVTADKLFKTLREGDSLSNLVVLGKDTKKGHAVVSMKGLLVDEINRHNSVPTFEDYKEGMVVPGYVKNITEKACFVGLLGDLVGMAKLHNISDRFVANPSDFLKLGQTVLVAITNVDAESRRFEFSLKHSHCAKSDASKVFETALLRSLFREQDLLQFGKTAKGTSKSIRDWAGRFRLGGRVVGTVKKQMPYGVIVDLTDGVSGLITNTPKGTILNVGTSVNGKIVDVNAERRIVDLIVASEDDTNTDKENIEAATSKKAKAAFDKGTIVDAVVQIVKEDYGILTLPAIHNAVAFALAKNLNSPGTPFTKFRVGQQLKVTITALPEAQQNSKMDGFLKQKFLVVPIPDNDQPKDLLDAQRTVKNSVDPNFRRLDDYTLGARVKGKITSIKDTQVNISLGANLKGRIHGTQVSDSLADITDPKHPLRSFKVGEVIDCKVIGFHDVKTHRSLPFSHRKPVSQTAVELTVRPSDMALPDFELTDASKAPSTLDSVTVGAEYIGIVQSVDYDALWIHISPSLLGRAHLLTLPDPNVLRKPQKHFPPGTALRCWVQKKDAEKSTLDLSLCEPTAESLVTLETVKIGQLLNGRITLLQPGQGLTIQVSSSLYGRVHLTDLSDTYQKEPLADFQPGRIVQCCVIGMNREKKQLDLSLRESRLKDVAEDVSDPEVTDIAHIKNDTVVSGYVRNVGSGGLFVALNRQLAARVKISELSDAFIKDWQSAFKVGQLVRGRIVAVNPAANRIEMSLKQSVVDPDANPHMYTWNNIEQGQKVKGTVKKIAEYGVFIQLAHSSLSGLCHKSELSDNLVNMIEKLYSVGDPVKAVVLKVDLEKKKLSLGLKASYFDEMDTDDTDPADAMDVDNAVGQEDASAMDVDDEHVSSEEDEEAEDDEEDEVDGAYSGDDNEESDDDDNDDATTPLDIGGFDWDGAVASAGEEEPESESDAEVAEEKAAKKKSRRAKQRAKREEEERIAEKEQSLLEGDKPPELAEDFERLLLGSPNSSFLWIKFMAFQLQLAEIEKAREVAERALKTISFREEQEKMNVWVALMNLENTYGTQESLLKVFERAVAMNNPKAVYIHLVRIYERTEKWDLANQLHQVMTKKFNMSSKIWTSYGLYQLRRGKVEDARRILQRSLQSLPKRKHVKTICKFAQMEFKYGEPERGRTIFEGIMSNYPKRIDLWSIYLDMEMRTGDTAIIRRLFERVINLKVSSKKMKFFFKKYLDYEKKHGTPESVEHVKQAAVAYVERLQSE
ncbi:hypothetical protein SpCBS45565_g07918 [Spizellomyces sp. 'palustris']|nr:hypothetical protein SpCBS45565_g07918 [Spizellomyces sp. 'palustris']